MKRLIGRLSVIALAACAFGWSKPAQAGISILNFQVGGIAAWSSGSSTEVFGQAAWTPYIGLGAIGVRGDFGFTSFKNGLGDRFLVTNYEALLSLSLAPMFSLEGGGGIQTWHSNGGSALSLTANLVIGMIAGIDRVYIGYSRFTLGNGVNQLRAGIGFSI